MTQRLFIDKVSGTFADSLLAYGMAVVVQEVYTHTSKRGQATIRLSDQGSFFSLDCTPALDDGLFQTLDGPFAPAAMIKTIKNTASVPADMPPQLIIDYEDEKNRRIDFFETRKALSKEALSALNRGLDHPELEQLRGKYPHPHWDILRALNPIPLPGYNKLIRQWWAVREVQGEILALLRDLFSQTPNDLPTAVQAWKNLDKAHGWKISAGINAGQIFNPSQGKGQNRSKADKLVMGQIKSDLWLLEWLKAVGFYHAAMTKQLARSKDRKTYVLCPIEVDLAESEAIMGAFQGRMARAEPAVRSDVLASLRYTQALLDYAETKAGAPLKKRLVKVHRPSRIVSGFYSAFYKNLGNSAATMNLSFMRLPGWVHIDSPEDVARARAVLDEHEAIVRQFDESHSDDYALLLSYRDFNSGHDLAPFFRFTNAYSSYIIGQRERRGGHARQFTTDNLERLIMSTEPKLSPILASQGFQNIAYAIRQSTVVAQYRKSQSDRRYNVRYGLGAELTRKANYPGDFVAALSDFLHKYNAENAQVMERRAGPYRKSIHMTDIDDIVALVDEYGAPLICNLLVAYGYARTPRKEKEAKDQDASGK